MAEGPELHERVSCRIIQRALTQLLKPLYHRPLWIGHNAMNRLLAINIRSMFNRATESILYRSRKETQRVEHKQKHRKISPVLLRAYTPARAITSQQALRHLLPQKKRSQQSHCGK